MNRIVFLGTGAGDITMLTQKINTSSLYCELDGLKFIIDPGPGTLVNAMKHKVNILDLNGIIISHLHPDHSTDANAILSGIRKNPSFLIAEGHCLIPSEKYYPCVSKFHQSIPEVVKAVKPGDKVQIRNLVIEVSGEYNRHYEPTVGFKIVGNKNIGYPSDGKYYEGQEKFFMDCDVMILNTYIPYQSPVQLLSFGVQDAIKLVNLCKPMLAVIQHYSFEMLNANPDKQAQIIEEQTKTKTIAAKDGMEIKLDEI